MTVGTQASERPRVNQPAAPQVQPPQPRPRTGTVRVGASVSSLGTSVIPTARIEAAGRPWWAEAPAVAMRCVEIAFLPVKWLVIAAEAAVALAFVGLGLAIWLWWSGHIPDALVADFLGQIGKRALGIVGKAGLF